MGLLIRSGNKTTELLMKKCVLTHTKESPHVKVCPHPHQRKPTCESKENSQVKVMLITFFDHQGMVHHEFVPQWQTVNQHFYEDVLTQLVNKIHQKRRVSWAGKT